MLAYVFWHRPGDGVDPNEYEEGLRAFHRSLDYRSAAFRLEQLPFGTGGGYEDWYLVEDWSALGDLNQRAVDSRHRPRHDQVAAGTARGWGGIYELVRGAGGVPRATRWLDKPLDEPSDRFLASLGEGTIWRRQLVLGPAPEYCAEAAEAAGRVAV
ncbi:MAG TPA: hypothetical protein VG816_08260 [Solirubrobacterales bacterium]|nr:hypothetical protein [Solirubrobacterales bacterium]